MRCFRLNPVNTVNVSVYRIEFINMAAYAQATYAATDQLKLTAGIRLNYDRTRGTSQGLLYRFQLDPANPAALFVPATPAGVGAAACQITHAPFPNCTVGSDLLRTSSKRPTWTLNAAYTPLDDVMLYATYARGYRQGAAAPAAIGAKSTFDPETVDNFELGAKTSFAGSVPGHFNLAGFYSKLRDAQQLIGVQCTLAVCPAGNSATSVFNAGKAHIYGVEFDGSLRLTDFFRLDASGAYVKSRLDALDVDITPSAPILTIFFSRLLWGIHCRLRRNSAETSRGLSHYPFLKVLENWSFQGPTGTPRASLRQHRTRTPLQPPAFA
jgi:iron complex outermembrane receptor protein